MAKVRKNRNLLPFRDYDEHDVVNLYSLDGTGMAGQLVKAVNFDLDNEELWDANSPVGADFSSMGVYSNRFANPAKVAATENGDTVTEDAILGLTLMDTSEFDENGQKLILGYRRKANENNIVFSGETVPVVTKGLFLVGEGTVEGEPEIGKVAVPWTGGGGKLYAADPEDAGEFSVTGTYNPDQVVGRWLSEKSDRNGYSLLKLEL